MVEILTTALHRSGFTTDAVGTADAAESALSKIAYDAMILDLGLPDNPGLTVLNKIRSLKRSLPVLILTARDSLEDRVRGLDEGADDYLIKPFAVPELISRVKALLRRPGGALGVTLSAGNMTLDTIARDVSIGLASVSLSRREIAVLEHLMRRINRVVPRQMLEEKLYGFGDELESNAVPVHIHHLRRKLEKKGATSEIHTIRGIGYILVDAKE